MGKETSIWLPLGARRKKRFMFEKGVMEKNIGESSFETKKECTAWAQLWFTTVIILDLVGATVRVYVCTHVEITSLLTPVNKSLHL